MSESRSHHGVVLDIETIGIDLRRLGSAIVLIGEAASVNGVDRTDGGGIEVLGDVIGERVAHLMRLVQEGCDLGKSSKVTL